MPRTAIPNEELATAAEQGMEVAVVARTAPDRPAIMSSQGDRTFAELNDRANQLVRALRARGLRAGDGVALLCHNRPEFVETVFATLRAGFRLTPINWHLAEDEVAYIVDDCEAKAFIADAEFSDPAAAACAEARGLCVALALDGPVPRFDSYEKALAEQSPSDITDPTPGSTMFYTSGTTGRPKGVYREPTASTTSAAGLAAMFGFRPEEEDVALATAPLYHTGPYSLSMTIPLTNGVPIVLMRRWDSEAVLRTIEQCRITHTFMVPTMFHRLLALPEETRARYDVSSVRFVLTGAAPTSVPAKQRMIDWFGPVVHEMYAATEGMGTWITPEEWLRKPGSVGRPFQPGSIVVMDEAGSMLDAGEVGTIYFRAPEGGAFQYFNDDEKTRAAFRGSYYTVGDMGYFDEDGYLYLTGRSAEVIISGGVNIYPAEIDGVLLEHPAIADVATIGAPDEEWGEQVTAIVQPEEGVVPSEELAEEIRVFCRERLAGYKVPRVVHFRKELPRSAAGKLYRHKLRDEFWGRSGQA